MTGLNATIVARSESHQEEGPSHPNTATLVVHLISLTEADSGLERVRELIRALAVEGRLTQNVDGGSSQSSWTRICLGDVGAWGSGGTPLRGNPEYYGGEIPWLKISDLTDGDVLKAEETITPAGLNASSAKMIPAGSVLIAMYGSIGKLGLLRQDATTNQAIAHCCPAPHVTTAPYLMLLLRHHRNDFVFAGKGAAQQNISQKVLRAFEVRMPPLAEQKRIVAKVDQLMALCDDLEARQTKKRETSNRLTKSALQALTAAEGPEEFDLAWKRVVENFDVLIDRSEKVGELREVVLRLAIRGRLTGRADPPPRLNLHEEPDERAPFAVPSGWTWATVGSVSRFFGGFSFKSSAFTDAGVGVVRMSDLRDESVSPDGMKRVSSRFLDELDPGYRVLPGSLLMGMSGSVGKLGFNKTTETFLLNQRVCRLEPVLIEPGFLYYVLKCAVTTYLSISYGSAIANLSVGQIKDTPVPLPPREEQKRIVAKVEQLMAICDDLEARLTRAEERASKLVEAVVQELVA